jgi:hypothetical protein
MLILINGKEVQITSYANLRDANLSYANLSYANLYGANFSYANLRNANLSYANLRDANLYGANLYGANLSYANLRDANLRDANLSCANLCDANLYGAHLRGSHLAEARFAGVKDINPLFLAITLITPDGDLIGYKKLEGGVICKLLIPAAARRCNAAGRKCRAEYAVVLEGEGVSLHDKAFVYKVGETVKPTNGFSTDRWDECAPGIHFYITRIEAENN